MYYFCIYDYKNEGKTHGGYYRSPDAFRTKHDRAGGAGRRHNDKRHRSYNDTKQTFNY